MTQYIVAQKLIRQPCGTFNPRFCENSMSRGDTEKNIQHIWPEKCSFCIYKVSGASSNIGKKYKWVNLYHFSDSFCPKETVHHVPRRPKVFLKIHLNSLDLSYKVSEASSNVEKLQMGPSVSFFIFILSQGGCSSRTKDSDCWLKI